MKENNLPYKIEGWSMNNLSKTVGWSSVKNLYSNPLIFQLITKGEFNYTTTSEGNEMIERYYNIYPLLINDKPLLDQRLRPIISKIDCEQRIAEIFSFIKKNSIKLLFIQKFNKQNCLVHFIML